MTGQKRCAIYCRRSLEQHGAALSSVESQAKICSSYIASQEHRGWLKSAALYNDEGVSGASLVRPNLQRLLRDIETGLVDVVVVYKLDRLTRTLLDFVRLLDLFEQYGVEFVCVTQNFDTTDSTGRLILNILLTFAQFEREIAGDRLRDKFGIMKSLGLFVGGHPAFGYDLIEKKLVPNAGEAKIVQWLFESYLTEKSYLLLQRRLRDMGVKRRERTSKRGRLVEGRPIHASAVWHMLGNPIYAGDVRHNGEIFPGQHQALVSRELWDQVQRLRKQRARKRVVEIYKTDLLRGLLYDSFGRLFGVLRDWRNGDRPYRYYISNQNEWGRRHSVKRFRTNADEIEQLVIEGLCAFLSDRQRIRTLLLNSGVTQLTRIRKLTVSGVRVSKVLKEGTGRQQLAALKALIEHGQLSFETTILNLRTSEVIRFLEWDGVGIFRGLPDNWSRHAERETIILPASAIRMKRKLTIPVRPLDSCPGKTNLKLTNLLARARKAKYLIETERSMPLAMMASKVDTGPTQFARLVRINYLAPDIVTAILDGHQPPSLTSRALMSCDLPMDWALQRQLLGFPPQQDDLTGFTPF